MISRLRKQNNLEKKLCIALFSIALVFFAVYIYLVSASVVHVVIRSEILQDSKKLRSEIALLEGRYIRAQHNISSEIASLEGYTEISKKVFIDRSVSIFVLADERN